MPMDAQKNLVLSIVGKDETKQAFDGVNKSLDNTGKKANTFKQSLEKLQPAFQSMATMGGVAFGAIGALAVKTISDFGESEKSAKQLEYAVINISKATKEQLAQTSALADELERKGVLDGDNIKMGMAQLSTFGLSNDAVQALGSSMADLAVNQFGVNASGEQLSDTANMMAKALKGQFGILEKSGIRFTEAQQKIIETGTEMEKVQAINEGFAQNLKYTNDVALTTFEGKLAKVKVQLGNVSEGIGQALLPVVERLAIAVTPVIEKMVAWAQANPDLITKIVAVGGGVSALLVVVGVLGMALPAVITGFTMLGTAIGAVATFLIANPIVAILTAIAIAGYLIYKNWDTIKEFAIKVWGEITNTISNALNTISSFLTGVLGSISNTWTSMWTSVGDFFVNTWNGINNAFNTVVNFLVGLLDLLFRAFGTDLITVLNKMSSAFNSIWQGISATAKFIWEGLIASFTFVMSALQFAWNNTFGLMIAKLVEFAGFVSAKLGELFAYISPLINTALGAIGDIWSSVWNGMEGVTTSVSDKIKSILDQLKGWVGSVVDWFTSKLDKIMSIANSIGNTASKFGAKIINAGSNITGKASGGFVQPGRTYVVGENGPELFTSDRGGTITPNNKLGGGGINIVLNITGNTLLDNRAGEKIGDMIIKRLKLSNVL